MWPWGHLALGYLVYSVGSRSVDRGPPTDRTVVWLTVGTQFPDLVDKPLAWYLHVLPVGRTLTHSALTAAVVIAALWIVLENHRASSTAFSVGYVSHLFGDALRPALAGDYQSLAFLAWPVLPPVQYETEGSLFAHLANFDLTSTAGSEFVFALAILAVWIVDGMPGWGLLGRFLGRRRNQQ